MNMTLGYGHADKAVQEAGILVMDPLGDHASGVETDKSEADSSYSNALNQHRVELET